MYKLILQGIYLFIYFSFSGVTISPIDETHFSLFAPTPTAMDEAKEKIDELLKEDVRFLI